MTDDEIKAAIEDYFGTTFANFGGDELFEGPCNCDEDVYDRACDLLTGAHLNVDWP